MWKLKNLKVLRNWEFFVVVFLPILLLPLLFVPDEEIFNGRPSTVSAFLNLLQFANLGKANASKLLLILGCLFEFQLEIQMCLRSNPHGSFLDGRSTSTSSYIVTSHGPVSFAGSYEFR